MASRTTASARRAASAKKPATRKATPQRPSQRRTAPRRALAAAAKTQLQTLRDNLGIIDGKITAFSRPLHAVQTAIREVKAPLNLPPTVIRRLDDLKTVLMALRLVATGLSWVPGPIGIGAKAADRAIAPFVASPPPPKGILQNARDAVAQVDCVLKPVRDAIGRIEKPVDKTAKAIDGLHGKVVSLIAMADRLLQHYGNNPPPGVESCAERLNVPLAAFLAELSKIETAVGNGLAELQKVLEALQAGLKPLSDVAAELEGVLKVFDGKAFQAVRQVLVKLVKALEPIAAAIRKGLHWLLDRVLKALHINVKAIENFFNQIIAQLNPLRRIQQQIDSLKSRVQALADKLLRAVGIIDALNRLEALEGKVEAEIDKFLQSACGKVMAPTSLPGERVRR